MFHKKCTNECDEIPPIEGMTQPSTLEEQPKLPHRLIDTLPNCQIDTLIQPRIFPRIHLIHHRIHLLINIFHRWLTEVVAIRTIRRTVRLSR